MALARAAAIATPSPSATTVITPRNVGDLQRLLATRQRVQATAPPGIHNASDRRDLPGDEIAPGLWLQQAHVPMAIPAAPLPLDFARRPEATVEAARLLFFDTETTGLAGGTGTRAFMIGAADWHHDPVHGPGLRVRQLLMATLGAESAMLQTFAGWLAADTVLSSFNGRSYDAPLLKTRYRLARLPEPLSACDHIDLLHPSRRRWKGLWENCRLGTIERNVLGIVREDDLPGSQAPGAWLDYLRGGSSDLLHRVAAHNHQDVVTLALLLRQLASVPASLPNDGKP
ncbi:ribonuclease H-like domain-containing protein [Stenotrophomonas ginsengisoli]|nr:ribonuclease H-like domain-containing protein [Stenotrophomonas ginsengisoli]